MKKQKCRKFLWLTDETGSVTIIEATILFPIVFFIIGFLILTSFYQLQKSVLQADVQRIASIISKSKILPEYIHFNNIITPYVDFEILPVSYPQSITDSQLYRYFHDEIKNISILETQVNRLIKKNAFLAGPKMHVAITCIPDTIVSQKVKIEVTSPVIFPEFFSFLKLRERHFIHLIGTEVVLDSPEFVRNIDMIHDSIQPEGGIIFKSFLNEMNSKINFWKGSDQ